MKNKVSMILYTNSKCFDIHNIFFDRLSKHFNGLDEMVVLSDEQINDYRSGWALNCKLLIYNESGTYCEQMLNGIDHANNEFIIYSQEDYILYDDVDLNKIDKYIDIMIGDESINFIRLIKSGLNGDESEYNNDLVIVNSESDYYFSTQITIWRKKSLKDMFLRSNTKSIFDEPLNSPYLREIGGIGLCTKIHGDKVGSHFSSIIYPYIATALVRGKWNTMEYEDEIDIILNEYSIDKNIRGING